MQHEYIYEAGKKQYPLYQGVSVYVSMLVKERGITNVKIISKRLKGDRVYTYEFAGNRIFQFSITCVIFIEGYISIPKKYRVRFKLCA